MPDIKLPNGYIMKNIPDGATKEQIMAKAIKAGIASESDFGDQSSAKPSPESDLIKLQDLIIRRSKGEEGLDDEIALLREKTGKADTSRALEGARPIDTGLSSAEQIASAASAVLPAGIDPTGIKRGFKQGYTNIGLGALEMLKKAGLGGALAQQLGLESEEELDQEIDVYRNVVRQETSEIADRAPGSTFLGEVFGESSALPIPIARGKTAAGTVGKVSAVGAAEGGLSAAGRGEDPLTGALIGAGFSAGVTGLTEAGQRLFRNIMAQKGSIEPQDIAAAKQEAEQRGVQLFIDESKDIDSIAARQKIFKEEGVTPTRGDVTKLFKQEKIESQLFEEAGEAGEGMRSLRLKQSEDIKNNISSMIDESGVPSEVGESVKDALTSRKKMLKSERKALYEKLAQEADNINLPVTLDKIDSALPDQRTARDLKDLAPGAYNTVDNALKDYGIIPGGEDVTPLSISNFESFRKALSRAEKADPNISVITGPIKSALDDSIEEISTVLQRSGNSNIAQLAKEARDSHIALKTEFDDKSMTDILIQPRSRGSVTPKVEESQVYKKLASKSTPPEQFKKVVSSLKNQGSLGQKGIADLKNQMILDIIDSAYSAGSRQINGQLTFGPAAFKKKIDDLMPKIESLYPENQVKKFKNLYKIAESIQKPSGAVPKGSAGYLMDVFNKLGLMTLTSKVPIAGPLIDGFESLARSAASKKQLDRAMQSPKLRKVGEFIYDNYPSISSAMGINSYYDENETEQVK